MEGAVKLEDFWMIGFGGLVYQIWRIICMTITKPLHSAICKEKTNQQKRNRYIERACECTAKMVYKMVVLYWGLHVLKQVGWLPWELGFGGNTSVREQFVERPLTEFPYKKPPKVIVEFGMFTAGYNLSELVRHIFFAEHKSDFMEMMFHHICSGMLVIGYLLPNAHVWGAAYVVLHDWSEVFMYMARISQATPYDRISVLSLAGMYISWIWLRLIILPYTMWLVIFEYCPAALSKPETTFEVNFVKGMVFVLGAMDFLYIYWFILIS